MRYFEINVDWTKEVIRIEIWIERIRNYYFHKFQQFEYEEIIVTSKCKEFSEIKILDMTRKISKKKVSWEEESRKINPELKSLSEWLKITQKAR